MTHVLDANGNIKVSIEPGLGPTTITTNTTLDSSYKNVLANTSAGGFTVTLPTASNGFYEFRIKKISSDANLLTIDAAGSELIDGSLTQIISAQYVTLTIINSAGAWYII